MDIGISGVGALCVLTTGQCIVKLRILEESDRFVIEGIWNGMESRKQLVVSFPGRPQD